MVYGILGFPFMGKKEKRMKIFRVIDNCDSVLTTFDELAALRLLRKIMEKHDVTYGWIDEEEVK
jgi:hypothetical protein